MWQTKQCLCFEPYDDGFLLPCHNIGRSYLPLATSNSILNSFQFGVNNQLSLWHVSNNTARGRISSFIHVQTHPP